jgi:hypothetical protein
MSIWKKGLVLGQQPTKVFGFDIYQGETDKCAAKVYQEVIKRCSNPFFDSRKKKAFLFCHSENYYAIKGNFFAVWYMGRIVWSVCIRFVTQLKFVIYGSSKDLGSWVCWFRTPLILCLVINSNYALLRVSVPFSLGAWIGQSPSFPCQRHHRLCKVKHCAMFA